MTLVYEMPDGTFRVFGPNPPAWLNGHAYLWFP